MLAQMEVPPKASSDINQSDETSAQLQKEAPREVEKLVEADARVGVQNYGRLPLAFVRGQGARLWDARGKEYLDFLGGIAVVTVGHCHPRVTQAINDQAATLVHSSNIYFIEPQVRLAERLSELSGGMRAFFCNSGAEANEAALKMARKWAKADGDSKTEIITTKDSFHGRTYAALAATGQPKYHEGFAPMPAGFSYVPRNDVEALKAAVNERTAAVMLEPVQGESGIYEMSKEYLQAARALCDEFGAALIFDEVQCGMGRTGTFFGFEASGVRPDIISMAKGLGNGVPIGALLAREEIASAFVPGTHGCTFGGNFLSCAAANATLDVLFEEKLMDNAREVGDYFRAQLKQWGEETGAVREIRGRGLMVGVSLTQPHARDLMKTCLENGLVFNAIGDDILRFLPPLSISKNDVDDAMMILRAAWNEVAE